MQKYFIQPLMILLAVLILMSVSGCKTKPRPMNHVLNEFSVYRTANPILIPAYSLYFINTNGQMEVIEDEFEIPVNWRFTGPSQPKK